ncbi:ATP-dependent DNA helicase RecG [Leptolyngbya sp. PCC 6406]|uniref:ATP-dependent DNA helicase RecG n=1 Tax=Leptolyngbya sp. PCC 6406 TaxID=1173264 RepID=UPI0002AC8436|nr:ATP-dependent DNA helicase RecG [Leptolyngbya sp. PCC 6406]
MGEPLPSPTPDWNRLQKALAVEAERGFNDLKGNQQHFSEFLQERLAQPPAPLPAAERAKWRSLATQFSTYPELGFADRQHLVAETRRTLYEGRRQWESGRTGDGKQSGSRGAQGAAAVSSGQRKSGAGQGLPSAQTQPGGSALPGATVSSKPPTLDQGATYLKGVGPKNAERLAKLGLLTVLDLLHYYPRDYINYAQQVAIRDLKPGETVTLVGRVERSNCFSSPKNPQLTIQELVLRDSSGQLRLSKFWPGQRFRNVAWQQRQKKQYPVGALVAASGLVKQNKYGITLDNPELEVLDGPGEEPDSPLVGRIVPVYPLTEGVAAHLIRRAIATALPAALDLVDPLPADLRRTHNLVELPVAIAHIHFPDTEESLQQARKRLVFDEFFYLQLGLLRRRHQQRQQQTGIVLPPTGKLIDQFYTILPFELTGAQQRVVTEILTDLQAATPMNRLVQGDVGSGKTVVAVVAILAALQAGYQAALMAPTEVLAEQHYRKLVEWFNIMSLPVELLTGSTRAAKRRGILAQLATGELPLLVGTHALIEDPVQFQALGLVAIDEQHRFGVQQRARLQRKGDNPHVLTLTATPIPRTLALTLHGDLEVSQIDELPPGRKAIKTTLLAGRERTHAYDLIRREVAQGHQVYIVLPLVDESEKLDLKSAIEEHQRLQEVIFPDFTVGLLHGRMSSTEKDQAITAFREGHTHILVSTTVVEVGVDVPNASIMLIEHAERFGLSQLHQLRGRVGRGADQSYCLLMSAARNEVALQRLRVLEDSQDGFFISEMDLRFRGPGQVLGTRQSGLPDFALASLVADQSVLAEAREAAAALIAQDPELHQHPVLRQELQRRYDKLMGGAILT